MGSWDMKNRKLNIEEINELYKYLLVYWCFELKSSSCPKQGFLFTMSTIISLKNPVQKETSYKSPVDFPMRR